MDNIDLKIREKINREKNNVDNMSVKTTRRLPNGNQFHYRYDYKKYVLRNQHGYLLQTFNTTYINNMTEEEYVNFLVECNKDNR